MRRRASSLLMQASARHKPPTSKPNRDRIRMRWFIVANCNVAASLSRYHTLSIYTLISDLLSRFSLMENSIRLENRLVTVL